MEHAKQGLENDIAISKQGIKEQELFIECECGAKILLTPSLNVMNRAIKDHVTHHKRMEKVDRKRANHLRQVLADQVIEKATQLAILNERKKMQVELEEYARHLEDLVRERTEKIKAAERFVAIGETAGMVGHDIRNPLQAITGDVFLAKTEIAAISEGKEKKNLQDNLTEIEKNVDYINKIVSDLQDYARPLKPNIEESDLKTIINGLLAKIGSPENVTIRAKIETEAIKVVTDASYINRIMYNLVTNALQAMPKGGKLTIHAYKEADDAVIAVKDTGGGIPEAAKSKLFTPMFTTKAKGQGFGLPVIKRMTEALGGTVTFESEEGKGTTFIVRLPQKSFTKE